MKFKNIFKGNFGIEKEALRVDKNGYIVKTPHPFKNKYENPYITIDFAEQQLEVISNTCSSIDKAIEEIKLLDNILYRNMNNDEYFWHYSMPYKGQENAYIGQGNCENYQYRKKLLKNSSWDVQLISGVHFNFSFSDESFLNLPDEENNELYFKLYKKYLKYGFLINQVFGMSPTKDFKVFDKVSYRLNRDSGYYNQIKIKDDFESYASYKKYINNLIKTKKILEWRSIYQWARIKPLNTKRIKWIEIRNIDLDFTKIWGLNEKKLKFLHQFLVYLALNKNLISFQNSISDILNDVQNWLKKQNQPLEYVEYVIKNYLIKPKPNIEKMIKMQIEHKKKVTNTRWCCYHDLELSTQLLLERAYIEGWEAKIIDQKNNLISIQNHQFEMATLTEFDSKKGLKIIANKVLTNQFLKKHNFKTTSQTHYLKSNKALLDFEQFKNKKIVIKPVNTNFSEGLTVLNYLNWTYDQFKQAIEFAFAKDSEIIIESFVNGKEYRFLVIGDELVGVLYREPANIIGNGKLSIKKLVAIANQHPYRGVGYKMPLEKIKLGEIEIEFLKSQNYSPDSIPAKNQKIFLRKNSNVSTGGSTYDVTDEVLNPYKQLAIKITKKLGLSVCGLDIIIPDLKSYKDYTILELNWNPAIHIHAFPLYGKSRDATIPLLKLIKEGRSKIKPW